MASFATMQASEIRCKAQVAANVWVHAHSARNPSGQIIASFQRFMAPGPNAGAGAWVETIDDSVN